MAICCKAIHKKYGVDLGVDPYCCVILVIITDSLLQQLNIINKLLKSSNTENITNHICFIFITNPVGLQRLYKHHEDAKKCEYD